MSVTALDRRIAGLLSAYTRLRVLADVLPVRDRLAAVGVAYRRAVSVRARRCGFSVWS